MELVVTHECELGQADDKIRLRPAAGIAAIQAGKCRLHKASRAGGYLELPIRLTKTVDGLGAVGDTIKVNPELANELIAGNAAVTARLPEPVAPQQPQFQSVELTADVPSIGVRAQIVFVFTQRAEELIKAEKARPIKLAPLPRGMSFRTTYPVNIRLIDDVEGLGAKGQSLTVQTDVFDALYKTHRAVLAKDRDPSASVKAKPMDPTNPYYALVLEFQENALKREAEAIIAKDRLGIKVTDDELRAARQRLGLDTADPQLAQAVATEPVISEGGQA